VLDIDSDRAEAFDEQDQAFLEQLVRWFETRPSLTGSPP
jgi:putative methionine-R-sulfoxide reductase with GAF domain